MSAHEDDAGRVCSMCGVTFDVHATLSPKCTGEPEARPEGHELGGCLYLINECVWVCAPGCRAARPEGEPARICTVCNLPMVSGDPDAIQCAWHPQSTPEPPTPEPPLGTCDNNSWQPHVANPFCTNWKPTRGTPEQGSLEAARYGSDAAWIRAANEVVLRCNDGEPGQKFACRDCIAVALRRATQEPPSGQAQPCEGIPDVWDGVTTIQHCDGCVRGQSGRTGEP